MAGDVKEKKKKTLVLLDSHAVLHRAFHALPSFTSPRGEPTGALYGFISMLLKIIKELKPDYLAACYDLPEPTFRHAFYKEYKAKRPKMDVELSSQIEKSKEFLNLFGVPIYEKGGFEADDVLATIVEQLAKNKSLDIIIVSGDLDTLQLVRPGVKVYMMKKGIKETMLYDEKAVKNRFGFIPKLLPDFKGLKGDPSDNIIGVVGIGDKTAEILIQNFGSLENIYKKLEKGEKEFEKAGIKPRIINLLKENEEEAFFSKALAETRGDVPVEFSLSDAELGPVKRREEIDNFLRDHGFRTLLERLFFILKDSPGVEKREVEPPTGGSTSKEKEAKLAFWLLDSRRTNPKMEDILAHTGANTPEEALKILKEEVKKENIFGLFSDIEKPLIPILADMEQNGVLLDTDYLKKISKDYHKRLDILQKKIWKLAGEKFNINSPKQLSEVLFGKMGISAKGIRRTGQGALSTRFSELEKMKDRHPIIGEIFGHRELAKLTSTYVDNLPKLVDKNGRLHTSFNQTGTATGRLSSSDPNLQNIPTRTDFGQAVRVAFTAPKGWKLVSFDYSQIELRIAAFLSGDEKLVEAFENGEDIHTRVASEVFGVPLNKVDKEMRRRAKVVNFGIIYGMGVNSLKKNLGCSRNEAAAFYDEYFQNFSGMKNYMEKTKEEAKKNGFTKTFFGRRRFLPEIKSPVVSIRKEAERMAINAPIQGTAADVMKLAMVRTDGAIKEKKLSSKVKMILQIHDELLFEVKNDTIKKMVPIVRLAMEDMNLPKVLLGVDVSDGSNWGEMKKILLSKK